MVRDLEPDCLASSYLTLLRFTQRLSSSQESNPSVLASSATFPHPREGVESPRHFSPNLKPVVYAQFELTQVVRLFYSVLFIYLALYSPSKLVCIAKLLKEREIQIVKFARDQKG